jgi:TrmH family RNA methyltransferase
MDEGWIVIEGPHLLGEIAGSRWKLGTVITTPAGRERYGTLLACLNAQPLEVAARAFGQTASTETAQEILALARPPADGWNDMTRTSEAGLLVALDGMQDPGNAGTIVRSAEAFGATGVILLEGSVRISNGKFLRATAGSVFRLPIASGIEKKEFVAKMANAGINLYALTANGEMSLDQADLRSPCALIVGSEGSGVSPELLALAKNVSIPTKRVESLNAAVACSLALFEAARQRGDHA